MPEKRYTYTIFSVHEGLDWSKPSVHIENSSSMNMRNVRIEKAAIEKRPGLSSYLGLSSGSDLSERSKVYLYHDIYQKKSTGERFNLAFIEDYASEASAWKGDLIRYYESGGAPTYQFLTPTYTTGTVNTVSGATVTGNAGTAWDTSGVQAGDMFIVNADGMADYTQVKSVGNATQITLSENYKGGNKTTGTYTYTIRKRFAITDGLYFQAAIINDIFCFVPNGNIGNEIHQWTANGTAPNYDPSVPLDSSTNPTARYITEYGYRAVIADCYISSLREPLILKWSKLDDPTVWSHASAGQKEFRESRDFLTGLGKPGGYLAAYKEFSIELIGLTGESTSPFQYVRSIKGEGCYAPYSIISHGGTDFFVSYKNIYAFDGNSLMSIADGKITHDFFQLISPDDVKKVIGIKNEDLQEVMFIADTSYGKLGFVYNLLERFWYIYEFLNADILSYGRGKTG